MAGIGGVIAFKDNSGFVAAGLKMAIQAVRRSVELAIFKPFYRKFVVVVGGIFYFGVRLDPVNPLAMLAPECFRILNRLAVHFFVLLLVYQCPFGYVRANRVHLFSTHSNPPWIQSLGLSSLLVILMSDCAGTTALKTYTLVQHAHL